MTCQHKKKTLGLFQVLTLCLHEKRLADLSSCKPLIYLVGHVGVEPTTNGLRVPCSLFNHLILLTCRRPLQMPQCSTKHNTAEPSPAKFTHGKSALSWAIEATSRMPNNRLAFMKNCLSRPINRSSVCSLILTKTELFASQTLLLTVRS